MMQRLKKTAALAVTLALSLLALATPALAAKAQLPELPKGQCVVDEAGVLSQNTVQLVEQLNGQLEANCQGAQNCVLTVEYTGNLSTEEYAVQAFNAWGIGSAKEDNGVLILLVMESPLYKDGDYYLTIGDGFRNTTMDKQASAIAQTMENPFARQDYDDAVEICAQNAAQTIAGVYGTSLTGGGSHQPQPEPQGPGFFAVLFDIALFLLVAWVVMNAVFAPIGRRTNFCFGPFWCWGPPRGPAPLVRPAVRPMAAATAVLAAWAAAPALAALGADVPAALEEAAALAVWAAAPAMAAVAAAAAEFSTTLERMVENPSAYAL